jgi:CRP-like cAMP-binding protein
MISPEVLRRYQFFNFMTHDQLRRVSMITNEIEVPADETIFHNGETADYLYLLQNGSVDLHFVVVDELKTEKRQDFLVGTVNPGEIMAISAIIEPHELTATAVTTVPSRLLQIDAAKLRELASEDESLAFGLQRQAARVAKERLQATRIQLLAASR